MSFEEVRLIPGINSERTPTLNQAGITDGALIRWKEGLVEKLGGWARFFPSAVGGVPRALHPWEDLNGNNRLAIGTTTGLKVITNGVLTDVSPQETITNGGPNFSTTASSTTVTVVDPNISNPTTNDFIFITTPISIGGIVLSGVYPIALVLSPTSYQITSATPATGTRTTSAITAATWAATGGGQATFTTSVATGLGVGENITVFGESPAGYNGVWTTVAGTGGTTVVVSMPNNPGASTVQGTLCPGAVPNFATTNASPQVVVTLDNHGLQLGQTYTFLVSTAIGGVTIFGNYLVQGPVLTNTFVISAQQLATSTTVGAENGGNVQIEYFLVTGPQPLFVGYGLGTYGTGGYGTGSAAPQGTGAPITPLDWSLLNFGEILIDNPAGFGLFQWGPESSLQNSQLIANGPIIADGCFLTQPQQIIVAWGASFTGALNPLRLVWCDAGNFNVWTPLATNFAGGFNISRGSKIVSAMQAPNQFLVWTDIAVWSGQYIGQPLVFSIIEVMAGCGLVGRKAAGIANTTVYWMSQNQFFMMAAGGVPQVLPCTVWSKVFQNIDRNNLQNVRFFANSQFNEIGWYFPVAGGNGENSFYAKYNTVENEWDYGPIGRSAWIDQSIFGPPIGTTSSGLVFQHEISPDADGVAMTPFVLTGDFVIGKGQEFGFIDYMIPDAVYGLKDHPQTATLLFTLFAKEFPNDPNPQVSGPFTSSAAIQFFEPRVRGRQLSMRIESQDLNSFWRMGLTRYRVAPAGRNP